MQSRPSSLGSLIQWTQQEVQTLKNPSSAAEFIASVEHEAKQFVSHFKASDHSILEGYQDHQLNEWFHSSAGANTTKEFAKGVLLFIDQISPHGLPGHDQRHMIIKTPLSALRFIQDEGISGYQTLLLLSAMLHDIGRIFEPTLFGKPLGGVMGHHHPLFSFCITSRLFDVLPPLPHQIQDHLLYALLAHQEENEQQLITQVVQRADREQLIGPEAIVRFLAFDVGLHHLHIHTQKNSKRNVALPLPGSPEDRELFHHIEFYVRNLYRCIGKKTQQRIHELKKISGQFLWIASPEHIRDQIFAPELLRDSGQQYLQHTNKPLLDRLLWKEIQSENEHIAIPVTEPSSIQEIVYDLISSPGAHVTVDEIIMINHRIEELPARERAIFKQGIQYIQRMQKQYDAQDTQLIQHTIRDFSSASIEHQIAQYISEKI